MVAAFMQLWRHGCGNHAVRFGTDGANVTDALQVPITPNR